MTAFTLTLRRFTVAFYAVGALVIAPFLSGFGAPEAACLILAGVAAAWVGSGGWGRRERWAFRAQAPFVAAIALGPIITNATAPEVAVAGTFVFLLGIILLAGAHVAGGALERISNGVATVGGFARVLGTQRALFATTFIAPLALLLAPNIIGVLAAAVGYFTVFTVTSRTARRRLTKGLARDTAT
ncbi:hypothetical protein [Microbacterium sp. 77mftsu3.1]|uniref:hypothetical protein n=1 Tax=Microbacterium sp. 77mftsu3.1 TaxID=1761802 RepID=UPI0003767F4F|nr:hypothetical protein [Microbacterium sp. 77mftsu3.1]SDH42331.1 hypothetical protein SAMN04488590_3304 [Microbacterium sp. 77mftsu3.1]